VFLARAVITASRAILYERKAERNRQNAEHRENASVCQRSVREGWCEPKPKNRATRLAVSAIARRLVMNRPPEPVVIAQL